MSIHGWRSTRATRGSLLYLALVLASVSALAVLTIRKRLPHTTPYALGVMALILAFFLAIMLFLANPLERLAVAPIDGQGINPLLIHFGMFIHPPLQMAGLVLVAVPFSIAIGALAARRGGARRVGGPGQAVGDGVVACADDGAAAWELVGVHDTRLGRILGVGSGGELGADAMVGDDRLRAFHHGAEAAGDVSDVEHGAHHSGVHAGADGDVHQPGRACAVGALVRAEHDGLAVPGVHGGDAAGVHRGVPVAL